MSASRCPKCNIELTAGKQDCNSCGWSATTTSETPATASTGPVQIGQIGTPRAETPSSPEKPAPAENRVSPPPPEQRNLERQNPERRNLSPAASPERPVVAAEEAAAKKSDNEKKRPAPTEGSDSNQPPQKQPAELPSSPTQLRDAQRFAMKQRGGKGNIAARTVIQNIYNRSENQPLTKDPAEVSLSQFMGKLPRREADIPRNYAYDLGRQVGTLREDRLILISSADEKVAFGAAYSLLDELGVDGEERLLLNFDRNSTEKSNYGMQFFTQGLINDHEGLTGIVVDGFSVAARTFVDWLGTNSSVGAMSIRTHLRSNKILVLCLVHPGYLEKRANDTQRVNFATWTVPFLQPLLKHYYPTQAELLERDIRAQQQLGKWKQTDAELCNEIRAFLDNDELPGIVDARRDAPAPTASAQIPTVSFKGDQSIEDTLLYAGTYFSDLPPNEFDLLVEWLLGDRTTPVTVKTQKQKADGTTEIIETEIQKPLREFWIANAEPYLETCQLETVEGANANVQIRFSNETNKQALKSYLERRHSLYLLRQFKTLHQNGVLTSTPNISAKAMRLSIDMAIAYPDSFGKEWLLGAIINEREKTNDPTESGIRRAGGTKNKGLERLTLFLRLMLEHPQLQEVVDALFKDLMSLGMHDTLLFMIRGLQFAPGFDEFYWMKRLLDEGDDVARITTYYHLYSYIKKIGIYPLLAKMEAWVPDDDRPPENYSHSCVYALRLLVEYCSEVTETFEPRRESGSLHHPLLTFTGDEQVAENCERLVGMVFHPAIRFVFADLASAFEDATPEDYILPFICELVVEWMFVLQEPRGKKRELTVENDTVSSEPEAGPIITAQVVRDVLIDKIAAVATPAQQEEMLQYWEQLRDFMALIASLTNLSSDWLTPPDDQERKKLLVRRALVKELIKRFRIAMRNVLRKNQTRVVKTNDAFITVDSPYKFFRS